MTTLYVCHCTDRHIDDEISVFSKPEPAIESAKKWMKEYRGVEKYPVEGWLYNASAEDQGSARVIVVELDKEVA